MEQIKEIFQCIFNPNPNPKPSQSGNSSSNSDTREWLNVNLNFSTFPTTVEAFTELRDNLCKSPQGAAACFVVALAIYTSNEELGLQCLTLCVDISHVCDTKAPLNVKGKIITDAKKRDFEVLLRPKPYIAFSYFNGANPENDYNASKPYSISIYRQSIDVETNNRLKIFVVCNGADFARPITLQKNSNGVWKAYEYSSILVSIRPPKSSTIIQDDL